MKAMDVCLRHLFTIPATKIKWVLVIVCRSYPFNFLECCVLYFCSALWRAHSAQESLEVPNEKMLGFYKSNIKATFMELKVQCLNSIKTEYTDGRRLVIRS